jgi:DNA-binding transcriptional MerR regulator
MLGHVCGVFYSSDMQSDNVIGAFSEAQAARISGVSLHQLRSWDKAGFFRPAFASQHAHVPYGRIYSFRDLVSLQVLNDLRNEKGISLQHLKDVSRKLGHLGDRKWSETTLYVLGKRVVLEDPESKKREEVVSGQRVFNIPLAVVIRNTKSRIRELDKRDDEIGEFSQNKFIAYNAQVFRGTRIPVQTVIEFLEAGYSPDMIIKEFPALTLEDIDAAQKGFRKPNAA